MLKKQSLKMTAKMMTKCKVAFTGTHPDSLYRVAALGGAEAGVWGRRTAHMMETCRPLRWPLALAAGCITLALLVFFLMPDSNPLLLSDNLNSTEWLQGEEQIFSRQSEESRRNPGDSKSQGNSLLEDLGLTPPKMSTEPPPPDTTRYFNKDDLRFEYVDEGALEDDGLESFVEIYPGSGLEPVERSTSTTPAPPLFPTNISPSVQYGNEHQDADSNEKRTQKKKTAAGPATDIYDSKFLTQTFAIFYNKDVIDATTGKSLLSSDSEQDNTSEGILDVSVDVESKKGTVGKRMPSFTSGHQNSFGIPIEEASKLKTTTPAAIYNTKVSPTLPSMVGRNVVRSTTIRSRWNTTDDGICNSTRLSMCRGVLPYDLTTQPLVPGITSASDLDAAVPYFDRVVRSGCSPRARQFVCALLEPECTPRGMKVLPPCRRACKAVAESCQDVLAGVPQLSSVFQCSQYPESGAGGACAWRGGPSAGACLAGEVRCPADNSCIPARWRCDGVADCPQATDEEDCDAPGCSEAEFRCGDNGSCIPEEWVCDGHQDCPGAEDEVSCSGSGSSHDVLSAASQYTRPARLPRPRGPVPVYSVTSRASPEYESSKELLMMSDSVVPVIKPISSLTARRRPSPATTTPRILQVTSKSSSTSVSQSTNCQTPECLNKNKEKMEKEDEYEVTGSGNAGTSHSSPCPQGELRCVDGRCITLAQLCDHHVDCTDGADEANCFT